MSVKNRKSHVAGKPPEFKRRAYATMRKTAQWQVECPLGHIGYIARCWKGVVGCSDPTCNNPVR
jgi:hypothetical protein